MYINTVKSKACTWKYSALSYDLSIAVYCNNELHSAAEQGAAAKQVADNKTAKYQGLEMSHIFFPVMLPSRQRDHGASKPLSWCKKSGDGRTTVITDDSRETTFLFVALQRGNAVSFLGTFA